MLTQTLPSYPYSQYADDVNVSAFFTAYNELSQENLVTINAATLPIYMNQSGALLDWCALGIYGIPRNNLPAGAPLIIGQYDTFELNSIDLNQYLIDSSPSTFAVTDAIYQSIIQWNTFKGDGKLFTRRWLKRRVQRFLSGTLYPDQTYQVSVTFVSTNSVIVKVSSGSAPLTNVGLLNSAIAAGACQVPFQYSIEVVTS